MRRRESRWASLLSCFRPRGAAPTPPPAPRPPPRQQQQEAESGPAPPASKRALKRLPRVRVRRPEVSCCICLEDMGVKGLRMPCGHIFHESCLVEWLSVHCTCPACRFEIGTDSAAFERERHLRNRVNRRFVTISRTELDELPIRALKDLLEAAGVSERRAVERRDLVDLAVQSDRVEVVEDRLFATKAEIKMMSLGELLKRAKSAGINTRGMVEKEELARALVENGEIVLCSN